MKAQIKVKTNSTKDGIEKKDDILIVKLKERAEKGKANTELVKILKKHFSASNVRIIKGHKSRNKIVEIIQT